MKDKWRTTKKEQVANGGKGMTFKQWLQETDYQPQYLSLQSHDKIYSMLLNIKDDGFMIDTYQSPLEQQAVIDAQSQARVLSSLNKIFSDPLGSDDSVQFDLGNFNDEDDQ